MTAARGVFVTGTDTGVGKTRVATALCERFVAAGQRVAGMKPLASGCHETPQGLRNDDALALLAAMNVRAIYGEVNPYAFEPAIAPHIAAQEAGCRIDLDVLDRAYEGLAMRSDVVVVEGAGGWLAPLDDRHSISDLAVRWRLPVILVVGMRLGCLNHALLTVEAVERRGLALRGWVANSIDADFPRCAENVSSLAARIAAPCLGVIGFAPRAEPGAAARALTLDTW